MGTVKNTLLAVICILSIGMQAQSLQGKYNEFRESVQKEHAVQREKNVQSYRTFREEANARYAHFVKEAWSLYKSQPAVPIPYEEPVIPPLPIHDTIVSLPTQPIPIPYDLVVTVPEPIKQPKPIAPIYEVKQPQEHWFDFVFYGTTCKVRLGESHRFKIEAIDEGTIAHLWSECSGEYYDNLIRDCLALRIKMNLCDYAYLQMLDALSDQFFGEDTNESVFLMSYLYCQSGYKMRFGRGEAGNLIMFYSSVHTIFGKPYYIVDGEKFYAYNSTDDRSYISSASFDQEQSMSLVINSAPHFDNLSTTERIISSRRYPNIVLTTAVNKNLIDFYATYPISQYSNNVMTQWAIYANTPVSNEIKETIYRPLQEKIDSMSQVNAVAHILNWVQTGFEYRTDNEAWGDERIFFAEETLYYDYCDCEDRSILFTRMVRDLLGLEAILVYYPGHLAAAVEFTQAVDGDYFELSGRRFIVCDPTYIGASVGMTMPQMNNSTAKLIKLD